ncbi:MAG TPA: hypothetical protein VEZ90_15630 [Blastocatellia bacterium]|nr:hypothetical protein [Blastocatellia bacterium]
MASQAKTPYTPEAHLEIDGHSECRNEYLTGEIFAMTGAAGKHNLITFDIAVEKLL